MTIDIILHDSTIWNIALLTVGTVLAVSVMRLIPVYTMSKIMKNRMKGKY